MGGALPAALTLLFEQLSLRRAAHVVENHELILPAGTGAAGQSDLRLEFSQACEVVRHGPFPLLFAEWIPIGQGATPLPPSR